MAGRWCAAEVWCAVVTLGAGACSRPAHDVSHGPEAPHPTPSVESAATLAPPVPAGSPAAPPQPACGDPGDVYLFSSPEHAVRGRPLRVMAVADHLVDADFSASGPNGASSTTHDRHGGPPYFWTLELDAARPGKWHLTFARDSSCGAGVLATKDVPVHPYPAAPPGTPRTSLWFHRAAWSRSLENVYSAWIQRMFEAPIDQQPSYSALHEVLRDRSKNLLFNHLGAGEDEQGMVVRPDCADLPYFLRAYFSFKLGLPFGWSHCSRGENGVAPTCDRFASSSDPFPPPDDKSNGSTSGGRDKASPPAAQDVPDASVPPWADPDRAADGPWENNVKRLGEFFRTTLADAAQSGAGRTPADDETGDYYPVALSSETLRPGTIFADPYGHVLVIAQRIPQTPTAAGILFAVDGQPDGTVARKRFWRGNFLFAIDPSLGSAGFKRFRPIVRDRASGKLRHLGNKDLPDYSPSDQYAGGVEGFYDRVDDILSPAPLDPTQALLETIQALEEQVKTRVNSVENGRKYLASGKPAAEMPDGAKIFEATGDWEDFSTPSRDLRLLIAIDVARTLPGRVARRPERYAMPAAKTPDQVRKDLETRLADELIARKFQYLRSDGSPWELRLRDVVDREAALEVAYNPNDCVELRWGASAPSTEASTCVAHASGEQLAKMQGYRSWFHERRRPPR